MDSCFRRRGLVAVCLAAALAVSATAAPVVFSGRLDDPGNAALVGPDLGTPQFFDDLAIANNVALHTFAVASSGNVEVNSSGFAPGGVDPYVSIFRGSGSTATFVGSNADNAFTSGGDFSLILALLAGDYTLAVGAFANMSFAENLGTGSLGDGFIGLGQPQLLGDTTYRITLDLGVVEVPEPPLPLLVLLALLAAWACTRWQLARQRRAPAAVPSV